MQVSPLRPSITILIFSSEENFLLVLHFIGVQVLTTQVVDDEMLTLLISLKLISHMFEF